MVEISDIGGTFVAEYSADGHENIQLGNEIFPITADFARDGTDLTLTSGNGDAILINDYFAAFPPPTLITAGGAQLTGDVVSKLAGPGPMAQSTNSASDANGPIGELTELLGTVTVKHLDGTSETLVEGGAVYQGDVIETGSDGSFLITFADDTNFSMGENGRAVLDEFIYNPGGGGEGSFGISLLQVFSHWSAGKSPRMIPIRSVSRHRSAPSVSAAPAGPARSRPLVRNRCLPCLPAPLLLSMKADRNY